MLKELQTTTATVKTPIKAIRAKCLDCSGDSSHEVRQCPILDCALHPFRQGKNPNRLAQPMTESRKAEIRDRLRAGREKNLALVTTMGKLPLEAVQS